MVFRMKNLCHDSLHYVFLGTDPVLPVPEDPGAYPAVRNTPWRVGTWGTKKIQGDPWRLDHMGKSLGFINILNGLVKGKIYTGNHGFYMFLPSNIGWSCEFYHPIQFYDIRKSWGFQDFSIFPRTIDLPSHVPRIPRCVTSKIGPCVSHHREPTSHRPKINPRRKWHQKTGFPKVTVDFWVKPIF